MKFALLLTFLQSLFLFIISAGVKSKSLATEKEIQVCNSCKYIMKELIKTKNSDVCDKNNVDMMMCYELYYYMYYFNKAYFYLDSSPKNEEDLCNVCSNLDKCNHRECLRNENKSQEEEEFDLNEIFTEKDSKMLSDNIQTSDQYNTESALSKESTIYLDMIANKLFRIKEYMEALLSLHITTVEYKTNVAKLSLYNEFRQDSNGSEKYRLALKNLSKDLNNKLTIARTNKDIRKVIDKIDKLKQDVSGLSVNQQGGKSRLKNLIPKVESALRLVKEKSNNLYLVNIENIKPKPLRKEETKPIEPAQHKDHFFDIEALPSNLPNNEKVIEIKRPREFIHVIKETIINDKPADKSPPLRSLKKSKQMLNSTETSVKKIEKISSKPNGEKLSNKNTKAKSLLGLKEKPLPVQQNQNPNNNDKMLRVLLMKINEIEHNQNVLMKSLKDKTLKHETNNTHTILNEQKVKKPSPKNNSGVLKPKPVVKPSSNKTEALKKNDKIKTLDKRNSSIEHKAKAKQLIEKNEKKPDNSTNSDIEFYTEPKPHLKKKKDKAKHKKPRMLVHHHAKRPKKHSFESQLLPMFLEKNVKIQNNLNTLLKKVKGSLRKKNESLGLIINNMTKQDQKEKVQEKSRASKEGMSPEVDI